ncbi:MAG: DUF3592 domain-containing protein [candidate division WOR-3 bacterium]
MMPPDDGRGLAPDRTNRRLRAILVAVGVAIFLAAISRAHHFRSLIFGLSPIIFLIAIIYVFWRVMQRSHGRERLETAGESALARIIEVQDTGTRVLNQRLVVFELEVLPPNRDSYTARTRGLVPDSEFTSYTPGAMVRVRYDPVAPSNVVVTGLERTERRPPPPEPPVRQGDEIAQAEALNQQLKTHGALARARILEVQQTGLERDGNPFLKFRLEVSPIGGEPFEAQAAAAIRAAALSAYEPGAEVWVKHDPRQPGRVALYNV